MSLLVGLNYAKKISIELRKPLLPIHHMEAHALVSRLIYEVQCCLYLKTCLFILHNHIFLKL